MTGRPARRTIGGHGGDPIHAYFARPTGPGPFPAVVLFHHRPGWDEYHREATRRFAHHGHLAISPDLYCRAGHGDPDDVAAKVNADGGVSDPQVLGDAQGCLTFPCGLPNATGHGFFYHDRPSSFRAGPAVDGWERIWDFLGRTIGRTHVDAATTRRADEREQAHVHDDR